MKREKKRLTSSKTDPRVLWHHSAHRHLIRFRLWGNYKKITQLAITKRCRSQYILPLFNGNYITALNISRHLRFCLQCGQLNWTTSDVFQLLHHIHFCIRSLTTGESAGVDLRFECETPKPAELTKERNGQIRQQATHQTHYLKEWNQTLRFLIEIIRPSFCERKQFIIWFIIPIMHAWWRNKLYRVWESSLSAVLFLRPLWM